MKICFATNNPNKLREIQEILGQRFVVVSLKEIGCLEELPETTGTIEGNSMQKAAYVHERYQIPVFADDTGLEVEALGGEPGVDTAFYAGPDRDAHKNMTKVLAGLASEDNRKARFRTVISFLDGHIKEQFEGIVEGEISEAIVGEGGFGYDPIFRPEGLPQTFAELSREAKNKISHRGRAIEKLVKFLQHKAN